MEKVQDLLSSTHHHPLAWPSVSGFHNKYMCPREDICRVGVGAILSLGR